MSGGVRTPRNLCTSGLVFFVISAAILAICNLCRSEPVLQEDSAVSYLTQYGYINPRFRGAVPRKVKINALAKFQEFAGLNVTGTLSAETVQVMNLPRCGVKDVLYDEAEESDNEQHKRKRRKRYALQGSRWFSTTLYYRIYHYPSNLEPGKVDEEIARAFQLWSNHSDYVFIAKSSGKVHIDITFARRYHDDNAPFDGPKGTLAHAFFPDLFGGIHFDDDEDWTIGSYRGVSLFQVATHEIGHSLGLNHSAVSGAIMAPFYRGYDPNFSLHQDDIQGVQELINRKDLAFPPHRPKPIIKM